MKYIKYTFGTLLHNYTKQTLLVANDEEFVYRILKNISYNISDDMILIKINEEGIKKLFDNTFSETFVNNLFALIRESTIVPLLMIDMNFINRKRITETDCKRLVRYAITSLTPFKLPVNHIDNKNYIGVVSGSLCSTTLSQYLFYSDMISIRIDDDRNISQFVSLNATNYSI